MGAVYEAEQIDLKRRVAVKVLTHAGAEETLRFKQEALAAAGLAHPNIVQVIDFVDGPDEPPILVMELLRGRSLASLVREGGKLPPARAVAIMKQVLSARAAAHEARIVHRDVKPENIFVCESPLPYELVKVLDFGLARPLDDDKRIARTRVGVAMGTPAYMAPEQARGESADVRVDVFSAGVTLYYALAGRRPFEGKTATELLRAVKHQPPLPLDALVPELDLDLVRVVERSLSKDPAARFASARAFLEALDAPAEAARAPMPEAAPPKAKDADATRGRPKRKRAAFELEPFGVLAPRIAPGIATVARFDDAGETALAAGPAGLARFRDRAWSARELPPGASPSQIRGFAFGPEGEAVVFGETFAWMRTPRGYVSVPLPDGFAVRGAHVDHPSHVAFAGAIGRDGVVVEHAPSGVSTHVIGRGLVMNAVTRAAGALVACGERGTVCAVAGGRVHAHVAGRSSLRAIAPLGGGFVAVGEGGAAVIATSVAGDGLGSAIEATLAADDLFAVRARAKWIAALGRRVHVAPLGALDQVASGAWNGADARDVWLGNGVVRVVLDDASVLETEINAAP